MIHGGNNIDTESAKMTRRAFAGHGYELEEVSVLEPAAKSKLQTLLRERRQDLAFFISSNFWALNVRSGTSLLHTLTGIPLVVLMHDHPVYFMHQLSSSLDGAIIFAPGADAADFIAKYYPIRVRAIAYPGVLPSVAAAPPPRFEEFSARKNMLLCPINLIVEGLTIDDAWREIKALPRARGARAERLAEAALIDCETPLHVISECLSANGDPEIAIEDLRPVLNFVKLWRRTRLVEAIVELPALISSGYVPPELARKYPKKFTTLTMSQTIPLYAQYRFVVNATPLLCYLIHDRLSEALLNNTACVTDANVAVKQYFEDEKDMIFVDYGSPDLTGKISRFLDDPQRAFALTVRCHEILRDASFSKDAHEELLSAVARPRKSTA